MVGFSFDGAILGAVKEAAGILSNRCPQKHRADDRDQLVKWTHDLLRKTGLSQKYASNDDLLETTRWGGNSPKVFHEHYKGLVKKKESVPFWSMLPESMPRDFETLKRINDQLKGWKALKYMGENPPMSTYLEVLEVQVISRSKYPVDEKLYEMVWSQSLTELAKEFGVTRYTLGIHCRKQEIPTPPSGHWTKIARGKPGFPKPPFVPISKRAV